MRLCDLGVQVRGTVLERRVERLHRELARAGFRFRPYVWLSTDWFTPDGVTGFAIPFFLAHPRLMRLERQQMFEVEGGNEEWCMKLLRHEAAHAVDNAWRLHRRPRWKRHFGPPGAPYRPTYVPRPNSTRYVQNLDNWYAQSHPREDFAETFAVWLQPRSRWEEEYQGWRVALRKLRYVDELMREIAARPPRVRTREKMDSLPTIRMTLREYYRRKKAHYGDVDRSVYDEDLLELFSADPRHRRKPRASRFLRERRAELRNRVAYWTGQYPFVVDEVLKDMIVRTRDLKLHLSRSPRVTTEDASILLTVHTMQLLRRRHREYFR